MTPARKAHATGKKARKARKRVVLNVGMISVEVTGQHPGLVAALIPQAVQMALHGKAGTIKAPFATAVVKVGR